MLINPITPIKLSTLGLIQEAFFDRRNIGTVTVGNKKYRRNFDPSEPNPLSRDFNSTIGDELSPRETKSKESQGHLERVIIKEPVHSHQMSGEASPTFNREEQARRYQTRVNTSMLQDNTIKVSQDRNCFTSHVGTSNKAPVMGEDKK